MRQPTVPPAHIRIRRSLTCLAVTGATALAGSFAPSAAAVTHTAAALVSDPGRRWSTRSSAPSNDANDFPGADVPFGMVQWSPGHPVPRRTAAATSTTTPRSPASASPTSPDPAAARAGDVPILPTVGAVDDRGHRRLLARQRVRQRRLYKVDLDNGVTTELTATTRSGMARFTFPATTQANLLFKLTRQPERRHATRSSPSSAAPRSAARSPAATSAARATRYTVYFDMVFDRPFSARARRRPRPT